MKNFGIWIVLLILCVEFTSIVRSQTNSLDFSRAFKNRKESNSCKDICLNDQECYQEKCLCKSNLRGSERICSIKSNLSKMVLIYFFCCFAAILSAAFLKVTYDCLIVRDPEVIKENSHKIEEIASKSESGLKMFNKENIDEKLYEVLDRE